MARKAARADDAAQFRPDTQRRARIEVETKLRRILEQIAAIERAARESGREVARAEAARREIEALRQAIAEVG